MTVYRHYYTCSYVYFQKHCAYNTSVSQQVVYQPLLVHSSIYASLQILQSFYYSCKDLYFETSNFLHFSFLSAAEYFVLNITIFLSFLSFVAFNKVTE